MTDEELEQKLLGEFEATLAEAWRTCRYPPHYFADMLRQFGACRTAKRLLGPTEDPQYGLFRLAECGRLDLSVEAIVLRQPYASLFDEVELNVARQRLTALGYAPERS